MIGAQDLAVLAPWHAWAVTHDSCDKIRFRRDPDQIDPSPRHPFTMYCTKAILYCQARRRYREQHTIISDMPMILDTPSPEPQPVHVESVEERRRIHHDADVVIVGAGILGSAIATTFARQGRGVILLEKSWKQPDRIVGELLQPGGVDALQKLGLRGA